MEESHLKNDFNATDEPDDGESDEFRLDCVLGLDSVSDELVVRVNNVKDLDEDHEHPQGYIDGLRHELVLSSAETEYILDIPVDNDSNANDEDSQNLEGG